MMLDNQKIRDMFAMLTDMPDQELVNWRRLCDSAAIKITGMLKPGVDIKWHMERLCVAAAACAYCDYMMLSNGGSASSDEIRVGDISLKSADSKNAELDAISTRDHFMAEIADLVDAPTGFAFCATGDKP